MGEEIGLVWAYLPTDRLQTPFLTLPVTVNGHSRSYQPRQHRSDIIVVNGVTQKTVKYLFSQKSAFRFVGDDIACVSVRESFCRLKIF
jgi:hypothetical protein